MLAAGAPEQGVRGLGVEFFPGRLQHAAGLQAVLALEKFRHAAEDVPPPSAHLAPLPEQLDAPLLKRPAGSGINRAGIERVDLPQAAALRAHPLRAVEAEQLRAGRLEARLAVRAGVMGRQKAEGGGRRGRADAEAEVSGVPSAFRLPPSAVPSAPPSASAFLRQRRSGFRCPGAGPTRRPRPGADGSSARPPGDRRPRRCCAASGDPVAGRR